MQLLQQTIDQIQGIDRKMEEKARTYIDSLAKPPQSLGKLESLALQIATITGDLAPRIDNKAVIVMAADAGCMRRA